MGVAALAAASPGYAQAPTAPTDAEVRQQIHKGIIRMYNIAEEEITDDGNFVNDFGFDSLDAIDLVLQLEKHFFISLPNEDVENANTVRDLIIAVKKQAEAFSDKDRIKFAGYALEGVEVGTVLRKGKTWQGLFAEDDHIEVLSPKFAEVDGLIHTGYHFHRVTKQNGRCGMVNTKGQTIIKPKFKAINGVASNPSFIIATNKKNKHYLFNTSGGIIFESKTIKPVNVDPSGRFIKAEAKDGRFGILNFDGEWLIEPEWTSINLPDNRLDKFGFIFFKDTSAQNSSIVFKFTDLDLKGSSKTWSAVMTFDYSTKRYCETNDQSYYPITYYPNITVRNKEGQWSVIDWKGKEIVPPSIGELNRPQVYGYFNMETQTIAVKHFQLDKWGIVDIPRRKLVANFFYDCALPYNIIDGKRQAKVYDYSGEFKLDENGDIIEK